MFALGCITLTSVFQPALAADVATFESCTDAANRVIAAEADEQQTVLVRTLRIDGQPALRYNPGVLPRLTSAARLFFYAHQCARQGYGARAGKLSAAQARQADCIGLNTLLASGALKPGDMPALQAELDFSDAEWALLPGPRRGFDLAGCHANGVLRLPAATSATTRQTTWNDCVRGCADRLWQCQKNCGGACTDCLVAHDTCKAGCGDADVQAAPATQ